ncbi:MAG TPA: four helix bundle protein [Gemmatimonadales bacterium]|jgi:four helix bundle protein|nr:four helix bundle protein [Gemmatimonadales bacterium]
MAPRGTVIRDFKDLEVWQRAVELVVESYRITKSFPSEERYGLIAQVRRAAVSVPSNIAEGRGRFGLRSFLYHLSVSSGSLMELETQLVIAERLQYLTPADAQALMERTAEVRRLLAGMVRALRAKQRRAVTDSQ